MGREISLDVWFSDYSFGHGERVWESQPVAGRLGSRFLPSQLEQPVEESWAECGRHAENLRLLLGVCD